MTQDEILATLDRFTLGYLEAALWSTNDQSNESGGDPLDQNYGFDDFADKSLQAAIRDCKKFQEDNDKAWDGSREEDAGHDFWLTRNGHGVGFWDGDWPEPWGELLTDACKAYGEVDLYVGDDGKLYFGGEEEFKPRVSWYALASRVLAVARTPTGGCRYTFRTATRRPSRRPQRRPEWGSPSTFERAD